MWMKRILLFILIVILFVVGRFYYTVFNSNYIHKELNERIQSNNNIHSIRIGTYNIKSLNYGDHVDDFINDIENLNLDVICLQEVDENARRSDNIDMVKEIARKGEYPYYYFFPTMWILDGYYGLGIVSKYPILEVESLHLPNTLLKEPRILTRNIISVGQKELTIYNTHLSYENNEYRRNQISTIQNEIKETSNVIVTGDFNSWGDESYIYFRHVKSSQWRRTVHNISRFCFS